MEGIPISTAKKWYTKISMRETHHSGYLEPHMLDFWEAHVYIRQILVMARGSCAGTKVPKIRKYVTNPTFVSVPVSAQERPCKWKHVKMCWI